MLKTERGFLLLLILIGNFDSLMLTFSVRIIQILQILPFLFAVASCLTTIGAKRRFCESAKLSTSQSNAPQVETEHVNTGFKKTPKGRAEKPIHQH